MKKDWFNGKIQFAYIDWIKSTLIIVPLGMYLFIGKFEKKETNIEPAIN